MANFYEIKQEKLIKVQPYFPHLPFFTEYDKKCQYNEDDYEQ